MHKSSFLALLVGYLISTSALSLMAFRSIELMTIDDGFYIWLLLIIINAASFAIPIHYFMKYKSKYYQLKLDMSAED